MQFDEIKLLHPLYDSMFQNFAVCTSSKLKMQCIDQAAQQTLTKLRIVMAEPFQSYNGFSRPYIHTWLSKTVTNDIQARASNANRLDACFMHCFGVPSKEKRDCFLIVHNRLGEQQKLEWQSELTTCPPEKCVEVYQQFEYEQTCLSSKWQAIVDAHKSIPKLEDSNKGLCKINENYELFK